MARGEMAWLADHFNKSGYSKTLTNNLQNLMRFV